jgi:hypothetical protein
MPQIRTIALRPPIGGIRRRFALQHQEPFTTPSALNCWSSDWSVGDAGRERLSTRPGITATGGSIGVPSAWSEAFWTSSGAKRGILVACGNGLWKTQDGITWVEHITSSASADWSSCASFLGVAYFARPGQTCLYTPLASAPDAGTALSNAGGGTAPTNCGVVAHYQDRLVLTGDTAASQAVYFSGTSDPTEWDYTDTTLGDAIPIAITVDEPPTCLAQHTRDCLIIGTVGGMYVMRGNPATGQLEKVSHYVGPLNQASWTHDSTGTFWYFSGDGLYKMAPGCGDASMSVSRESLPDDFVAVNPATASTYSSLSFDPRFRCLWLFVDHPSSDPADTFWSYDLQNGAWFTHSFTNGPMRLGATLKSAGTADKSAVIAFNASGTAYQFDRDSTESFSASAWIGPIALGGPGQEGRLHAVQASLAASSGNLSWEVYVGNSAEQAFNSSAAFTGADWTVAGLNSHQHPGRRGAYAFIRVFSTGTTRWSIEGIDATLHTYANGLRRLH